jgi:chromate transporter
MLKLFLLFLKINLLTTSGPASLGLTKKLVVPEYVDEEAFNQMMALASGIPGSDAVQMAWQVGHHAHGWGGAGLAVVAALLPSIAIVTMFFMGMRFISPELLSKFFSGVNPALAVMLALTAWSLFKPSEGLPQIAILIVATIGFSLSVPAPLMLLACGLMGVLLI